MDWPHDPDGEKGSEAGRKYGHAVLVKMVDEDDFPLARESFVAAYGDYPVRIDADRVVSVADLLAGVDRDEFGDLVEFHRAVGRAMREGGYWPYEGADAFVR